MTEDRIPTNLRTLLILEILGKQAGPMTPAQIGRAIGLPKQTVHRLCRTLIDEGFLTEDERRIGLRPARRARELGAGLLHASSSYIARRAVLENLATEVGETVNFVVPEDRGMAYHDRVETNWAFRIQLPIGSHVPFHCTASGKAYLASLPRAERRRMVQVMALEKLTDNTITDPDALLSELALIAKQGFAMDNEEFMEGMLAIAAPVRDLSGRYIASIAFHGPSLRITPESAKARAPVVQAASAQLTKVLFASPAPDVVA